MSEADGRGANKQTLIEAGTTFKGSFASDCPIVVRGRVEGDLSGPSLTVSSTGVVSGTVKVTKLTSDGELSGEYDAEIVQLSGVVKDNTVIRAKTLEVKLSPERGRMQVVFGECDLEVGDVPSAEETLAAAEAAALPGAPVVDVAPSAAIAEAAAFAMGASPAEAEEEGAPKTDPPPAGAAEASEESSSRKRKREGRASGFPPQR
jgi:cytoskeletal protein CcmA (bactofilin family)